MTYVSQNPFAANGGEEWLQFSQRAGRWRTGEVSTIPETPSCAKPGYCSAVGVVDTRGRRWGLMMWTETRGVWGKPVPGRLPSNARDERVTIEFVSCASPGSCIAVGTYIPAHAGSGQYATMLLNESRGVWGRAVGVNGHTSGAGPGADLTCNASRDYCTLLTSSSNGQQAGSLLVAKSDRWQRPVRGVPSGLYQVRCASAGNCAGTGAQSFQLGGRDGFVPTVYTEVSGRWSGPTLVQLPANGPRGYNEPYGVMAADDGLWGLSCPSAGSCSAIGTYDSATASGDFAGTRALLVNEINGRWQQGTEAVLPADAGSTPTVVAKEQVSCVSAGNCSAIATYLIFNPQERTTGQVRGLLMNEVSGVWRPATEAILPGNAAPQQPQYTKSHIPVQPVASLDCTPAGNCSAVGNYLDTSGKVQTVLYSKGT